MPALRTDDGPILEPLELLRLAGIRDRTGDAANGVFAGLGVNGFLYIDFSRLIVGVRVGNADFAAVAAVLRTTVFVDAELFNDDRELRKLVREPLRSTTSVTRDFTVIGASPPRRNEFVRFGNAPAVDVRSVELVDGIRSDRLRSSD